MPDHVSVALAERDSWNQTSNADLSDAGKLSAIADRTARRQEVR
jgi:hypothetical protein